MSKRPEGQKQDIPKRPEARSNVRKRPEEDPKKASRLEARHARRQIGQKRGMPEGQQARSETCQKTSRPEARHAKSQKKARR